MTKKKNTGIDFRWVALIFVIGVLGYLQQNNPPVSVGQLLKNSNNPLSQSSLATEIFHVQQINKYLGCGHEIILQKGDITSEQLAILVENNQNLEVRKTGDMAILVAQKEGLCPLDAEKRHLGVVGEHLAIFKGPIDIEAEIEVITQIRIDQMPEEWQIELLSGKLEFGNEISLLEALDSLDEYLKYTSL